jgi:glucose/arabinose dehydrogenase
MLCKNPFPFSPLATLIALLTKGECHAPDHYPDDSPYRTVVACGCLAARERVEVLQNQLEHPWALAFLPDDRGILMTLRGGELRLWQRVKASRLRFRAYRRSGPTGRGLLDVALAPDFAQSRRVWLSYAEGGMTARPGPP